MKKKYLDLYNKIHENKGLVHSNGLCSERILDENGNSKSLQDDELFMLFIPDKYNNPYWAGGFTVDQYLASNALELYVEDILKENSTLNCGW